MNPSEMLNYLVYHLDRSCLNSRNFFLLNSSYFHYLNTNRFTPNVEKQLDKWQNYLRFGLYPIYFIVFLSLSFIYEILWAAALIMSSHFMGEDILILCELSVCLSVRLSAFSCPLYNFNTMKGIQLIFGMQFN